MPVFQETAHSARDLRILPSRAAPLPRLTPPPVAQSGGDEKYEVVVIGAGPAGLLLTLCLARYGLTDDSLICFDAKPGTLKAGQADGLQPRTLEVLKSLGVAQEILSEGCHMSEVAFWNPKDHRTAEEEGTGSSSVNTGIERTSFVPDVIVAARYQHEVTIHQGRIERILEEDLRLYSKRSVVRSHHFIDFQLDKAADPDHPLLIQVEEERGDGTRERKSIRAKHLVGADGAHSNVRRAMGLKLEGETTDHIWGVVDFVADTDFPDIRKRSAIHSEAGSVMVIPRERIDSGHYLTRLYVQVKDDEVPADADVVAGDRVLNPQKSRERRAAITLEYIFEQAQRVFAPYKISVMEHTVVDWWAAYQIGQRMAPKFSLQDAGGVERVFIVGDACHTHSPKAGQGMNVSMMDSYNLSWKLVHSLHGLTPKATTDSISTSDRVLATFAHERLTVAKQLIDFDSKFSSMFSGQIGAADPTLNNLTHEQFLKVFSDGSGFTSGCGIEYPPSLLIAEGPGSSSYAIESPVIGDDYLQGTLKPGRRLLDVQVRRYADANPRHLQDDFLSTGRYRILVLASSDLLVPQGRSANTLNSICKEIIPLFPRSIIELVVVHPIRSRRFEWTELPPCLKEYAEMRFHGLFINSKYNTNTRDNRLEEDVYSIYGVAEHEGAVVVVRPDGYVGLAAPLWSGNEKKYVEAAAAAGERGGDIDGHGMQRVMEYFKQCLVSSPTSS